MFGKEERAFALIRLDAAEKELGFMYDGLGDLMRELADDCGVDAHGSRTQLSLAMQSVRLARESLQLARHRLPRATVSVGS